MLKMPLSLNHPILAHLWLDFLTSWSQANCISAG